MNVFRLLNLLRWGLGLIIFAARAEPIPLEDFFRPYDFDQVELSPDGTRVSVLARQYDRMNLYVIDLATKQPRAVTSFRDKNVVSSVWVTNDRLLFMVGEDGYLSGGLFAINADGSRFRILAGSVDQQASHGSFVYRDMSFLSRIPGSEDEVLVTSNERDEFNPDVYRINTTTGRKRMIARNPGGVDWWVADRSGAVRAAFGESGLVQFALFRETADAEWREVWRTDADKGELVPEAFTADGEQLYVLSGVGRNTFALCRFDPHRGEVVEELFADSTYDINGAIVDVASHELLGVTYVTDRTAVKWLEPRMAALRQMIDEALPGTLNQIVSQSHDGRWVVVFASSDRDAGTYFLLETRKLTLEKLLSRAPWVEPSRMAEMRSIQYPARDGRVIHGYLTLPLSTHGGLPPLIVNPHGGPWTRDEWGFSQEIQFLASRGYAVLQVNFRGSTGYGRDHLEAGYGQWGLTMQDDITDGVRWAIDQGYVDPQRVAIYGASYGGYAAMAGVTFTPELYRCGINYVGVTDIALLLRTIPDAWEAGRKRLEAMTGNARTDRARLEATSPLKHVANIRAPLLLAYGEQDPRVVLKHAEELISELKRHKKPYEAIIKRDEGHGFYRQKNRLEFYGAMERFLQKHLSARPAEGN